MRLIAIILCFCCTTVLGITHAQCPQPLTFNLHSELPFQFPKQAMTVEPDRQWRPYIYVAAKEQGLLIYSVSNPNAPVRVKEFPVGALDSLEVMSVTQNGSYLYLALGNHFAANQNPGIAIVNVSDPPNASLTGLWKLTTSNNGAGIAVADGDYAYLGAMEQGLIVLDVSKKNDIQFVSQFIPSISYPNPNNPDPLKYNARGMAVRNDKVYLCYDAGGVRIIDVTNKKTPAEIGHYSNPAVNDRPRAYNNIALGPGQTPTYAFVAADYCGMEVLDVSDPTTVKPVSWWNPWGCESSSNTWFNSQGHANEIQYYPECNLLFMSTGRSQISVVNVSDPTKPTLCGNYGTTDDKQGTWGLGVRGEFIYAAYIFVPLGIPFPSNWGGVKIIQWGPVCDAAVHPQQNRSIGDAYPNPSSGRSFTIEPTESGNATMHVTNAMGETVLQRSVVTEAGKPLRIDHELEGGVYCVTLTGHRTRTMYKIMIIR